MLNNLKDFAKKMNVTFELNNDEDVVIEQRKLKLGRKSFPIKVRFVNKDGNEEERLIFFRNKRGNPVIVLS